MTLQIKRSKDPAVMDALATTIVERVFANLKPTVAQYPDGIQIGSYFVRPEETGRGYEILAEVVIDPDPDLHPNAESSTSLEYIETQYSLDWSITRALILQLEPRIEQLAFDVAIEEERKLKNAAQGD